MTFTRWTVLLFLIVPITPKLTLAEGPPPITPDELKMTSDPLAPGAPAVMLYRQVDRDDSGQTAHETNFVRIKILKEEGRKYGDVEIPFLKENGLNIVNIRAKTIRPDGSEVPFQAKVFDKMVEKRLLYRSPVDHLINLPLNKEAREWPISNGVGQGSFPG